jgi:hypothetical protein
MLSCVGRQQRRPKRDKYGMKGSRSMCERDKCSEQIKLKPNAVFCDMPGMPGQPKGDSRRSFNS